MFRLFEGSTADALWQNIAESFRSGEFQSDQCSRAGKTSEILHAALSLSDPRQRWVSSRQPPLNIAFALAEVVWIIRGRNDAEFLNYFNRQLPAFAGCSAIYHGAYGHRLRKNFGIDQLERAYGALREKPDCRQVVLQIWDASKDMPDEAGRPPAEDIPCNISSLVKVRNGQLEWLQVMRSNDVFRGLPYNIVQFTSLQEVLAGWLGVEVGPYHHLSDSLHVYDDCEECVWQSESKATIRNVDNLAEPKSVSDAAFQKLEALIEHLISPDVSAECLLDLSRQISLPNAFVNIAQVLCAEGARRRGRRDIASALIQNCSNPVFVVLYNNWLRRTSEAPHQGDRHQHSLV